MNKVTILRKGKQAMAFDAIKVFSDYFGNKGEEDKKLAAAKAEERAKQALKDAEAKKEYNAKYASVMAEKAKYLAGVRESATKSATGLEYKITKPGTGVKAAEGSTFYIHYAGYLEDGSLFDSSYEEVCKTYGKFDENRAKQNGYSPFPFQAGKKDGLIPGFLEGIGNLSFGDKAVLFIPSALGYGERGAGNVIPPNSNIIFEVELFEKVPTNEATPKQ
jgi:FKBP-type peptidyl-prolyl cis-trans isomerase